MRNYRFASCGNFVVRQLYTDEEETAARWTQDRDAPGAKRDAVPAEG
jgi:hypothetical protein